MAKPTMHHGTQSGKRAAKPEATQPDISPVEAPHPDDGEPELVITDTPIHAGNCRIRDGAPLADVLFSLFMTDDVDRGFENSPEHFLQSAIDSVIDELAIIQLAAEHEVLEDELPRLTERLRHRLVVAQWLFGRMRAATAAENLKEREAYTAEVTS